MVGQSSKFVEEDVNMSKYHGKRRNATTNIRTFSEHAQGSTKVGRVNQNNPIFSRLSTNRTNTYNKKDFKWQKNDNFDRRTKSDSERSYSSNNIRRFNKNNKEVVSTMKSVGRLKISQKTLKIGDSNDEVIKQFKPTQSFCKLANMEQEVFDLIVKFMQQYFSCFDKNRDELLGAYHARALYSISFNLKSPAISRKQGNLRFGTYVKDSRNLNFVVNEERAHEMLHRSNIDIVAFLKRMPVTQHISDSLKLDSCFFQPNMLTFSISGIYKEIQSASEDTSGFAKTSQKNCYRSFQRTFVCVPVSNVQMIIVNEQCILSNLSDQQSKIYKEESLNKEVNMEESNQKSESEEEIKQNMIQKFSASSNLTLNWAKDCLEFSNWNLAVAEKNFFEHKNDIPAEAFIKKY